MRAIVLVCVAFAVALIQANEEPSVTELFDSLDSGLSSSRSLLQDGE